MTTGFLGIACPDSDGTSATAVPRSAFEVVARECVAQGMSVEETVGFGEDLPIRENAKEEGRLKNRRLEVFITR